MLKNTYLGIFKIIYKINNTGEPNTKIKDKTPFIFHSLLVLS